MAETKHTPTPWEIDGETELDSCPVLEIVRSIHDAKGIHEVVGCN